MDIVYSKKYIMVSTGMEIGKSLIYKVLSLINPGDIVLIIKLTIMLVMAYNRQRLAYH